MLHLSTTSIQFIFGNIGKRSTYIRYDQYISHLFSLTDVVDRRLYPTFSLFFHSRRTKQRQRGMMIVLILHIRLIVRKFNSSRKKISLFFLRSIFIFFGEVTRFLFESKLIRYSFVTLN